MMFHLSLSERRLIFFAGAEIPRRENGAVDKGAKEHAEKQQGSDPEAIAQERAEQRGKIRTAEQEDRAHEVEDLFSIADQIDHVDDSESAPVNTLIDAIVAWQRFRREGVPANTPIPGGVALRGLQSRYQTTDAAGRVALLDNMQDALRTAGITDVRATDLGGQLSLQVIEPEPVPVRILIDAIVAWQRFRREGVPANTPIPGGVALRGLQSRYQTADAAGRVALLNNMQDA